MRRYWARWRQLKGNLLKKNYGRKSGEANIRTNVITQSKKERDCSAIHTRGVKKMTQNTAIYIKEMKEKEKIGVLDWAGAGKQLDDVFTEPDVKSADIFFQTELGQKQH